MASEIHSHKKIKVSKRLLTEKKKYRDAFKSGKMVVQTDVKAPHHLLLLFCRKYPRVSPKNALCADLRTKATKCANQAQERKIRQFEER